MKEENKEVFIPAADLRESSNEELESVIDETQKKLLGIREQSSYGIRESNVEKPHLVREYKKLIARCKTILNERP